MRIAPARTRGQRDSLHLHQLLILRHVSARAVTANFECDRGQRLSVGVGDLELVATRFGYPVDAAARIHVGQIDAIEAPAQPLRSRATPRRRRAGALGNVGIERDDRVRRRIADARRWSRSPRRRCWRRACRTIAISVPRRNHSLRAGSTGGSKRDVLARDAGGRRRHAATLRSHAARCTRSRQIGAAPVTPDTSCIGAPEKLPTQTPTV